MPTDKQPIFRKMDQRFKLASKLHQKNITTHIKLAHNGSLFMLKHNYYKHSYNYKRSLKCQMTRLTMVAQFWRVLVLKPMIGKVSTLMSNWYVHACLMCDTRNKYKECFISKIQFFWLKYSVQYFETATVINTVEAPVSGHQQRCP